MTSYVTELENPITRAIKLTSGQPKRKSLLIGYSNKEFPLSNYIIIIALLSTIEIKASHQTGVLTERLCVVIPERKDTT